MGLENVLIGHLSANPGKGFYSNIFAFFAGFVQIKSYLSSGIRSMTIMREGRNDISMCVFYLFAGAARGHSWRSGFLEELGRICRRCAGIKKGMWDLCRAVPHGTAKDMRRFLRGAYVGRFA